MTFFPKINDRLRQFLIEFVSVMCLWMVNGYIVLRLCHIINVCIVPVNMFHAWDGQVVLHEH